MTWAGESAQSGVFIFSEDGSPGEAVGVQGDLFRWGAGGMPEFIDPASITGVFDGPSSSTDNAIVRWDGTDGKNTQDSEVYVTDSGNIENPRLVVFRGEYDNGDSGATATINWNEGQKQRITLTDSPTLTFVHPPEAANFLLKIVQDSTGNRTITWPTGVLFPNGQDPNLTNQGDSIDIVTFYYDGNEYFGVGSLDFS